MPGDVDVINGRNQLVINSPEELTSDRLQEIAITGSFVDKDGKVYGVVRENIESKSVDSIKSIKRIDEIGLKEKFVTFIFLVCTLGFYRYMSEKYTDKVVEIQSEKTKNPQAEESPGDVLIASSYVNTMPVFKISANNVLTVQNVAETLDKAEAEVSEEINAIYALYVGQDELKKGDPKFDAKVKALDSLKNKLESLRQQYVSDPNSSERVTQFNESFEEIKRNDLDEILRVFCEKLGSIKKSELLTEVNQAVFQFESTKKSVIKQNKGFVESVYNNKVLSLNREISKVQAEEQFIAVNKAIDDVWHSLSQKFLRLKDKASISEFADIKNELGLLNESIETQIGKSKNILEAFVEEISALATKDFEDSRIHERQKGISEEITAILNGDNVLGEKGMRGVAGAGTNYYSQGMQYRISYLTWFEKAFADPNFILFNEDQLRKIETEITRHKEEIDEIGKNKFTHSALAVINCAGTYSDFRLKSPFDLFLAIQTSINEIRTNMAKSISEYRSMLESCDDLMDQDAVVSNARQELNQFESRVAELSDELIGLEKRLNSLVPLLTHLGNFKANKNTMEGLAQSIATLSRTIVLETNAAELKKAQLNIYLISRRKIVEEVSTTVDSVDDKIVEEESIVHDLLHLKLSNSAIGVPNQQSLTLSAVSRGKLNERIKVYLDMLNEIKLAKGIRADFKSETQRLFYSAREEYKQMKFEIDKALLIRAGESARAAIDELNSNSDESAFKRCASQVNDFCTAVIKFRINSEPHREKVAEILRLLIEALEDLPETVAGRNELLVKLSERAEILEDSSAEFRRQSRKLKESQKLLTQVLGFSIEQWIEEWIDEFKDELAGFGDDIVQLVSQVKEALGISSSDETNANLVGQEVEIKTNSNVLI